MRDCIAAIEARNPVVKAGLYQSLRLTVSGVRKTAAISLSVVAWVLMVLGMMLPISAKSIEDFVSAFEGDGKFKIALCSFVLGYLLLALIFGIALHGVGFAIGVFAQKTGVFFLTV